MGTAERIGVAAPPPAVMAILNRFTRPEIAAAIEVMVALLDIWDGDPDNEPNGDDEPLEANGDTKDSAWIEWAKMSPSLKGLCNVTGRDCEDDEQDNEDRGLDEGEPHFVTLRDLEGGAGCPIADPGGCQHDGREPSEGGHCAHYGEDQTKGPLPPERPRLW